MKIFSQKILSVNSIRNSSNSESNINDEKDLIKLKKKYNKAVAKCRKIVAKYGGRSNPNRDYFQSKVKAWQKTRVCFQNIGIILGLVDSNDSFEPAKRTVKIKILYRINVLLVIV